MLRKSSLYHFICIAILILQISCNGNDEKQLPEVTKDVSNKTVKPTGTEESVSHKTILVLHSAPPEDEWAQDINKGILQGLKEERFVLEKNISLSHHYLNATDIKDTSQIETQLKGANLAISKVKPDIIISADDFAAKNVISTMKLSNIKIVFLGINGNPREYGIINNLEQPEENITGVIERVRFSHSVKLLRRLLPSVQKMAIICDKSLGNALVISRIKAQASLININIVAALETDSFTEWKKFVLRQQSIADALIIVGYHTLKNDQGGLVDAKRSLYWTLKNSKIPEIGFWPQDVKNGILCSEAISGFQQGYYAATLASYILMGQSPSDFPVSTPPRGELCLNLSRAKMLNIQIPDDLKQITRNFKMIGSADGITNR